MWENTSIAHVLEHTRVQKCLLLGFSCHCKGIFYATLHQTFNSWCRLVAFYCFLGFFTLNYGSCLLATRIGLIYADVTHLRLSLWKTFLPNWIAMQVDFAFPDVLKSVFVTKRRAPKVCPVPFNSSDLDVKWKGYVKGPGDVCRRKCSGCKEAACFI